MTADNNQHQYRASASVILAARTPVAMHDNYDYEILLFKRTSHTAYAPNHCVFPGGVYEEAADESPAWLQYFREFGVTEVQLKALEPHQSTRQPVALLTTGGNFSRNISLRITALREAFEEVGVLLCRDKTALQQLETPAKKDGCARMDFDRVHWQRVVHDNAHQFLNLCQLLQVVPDLWCLHEWSLWRSPITATKKYDTVFYFAALEAQPHLLLERNEVELALWRSPTTFLQEYSSGTIWLPPIQLYELSRLSNAHHWAELLQFAQLRGSKGSTLLMPVYYRCDDGLVGTLPGDDFYPTNPMTPLEHNILDCSAKEFSQRTQRQHRIVLFDMHNAVVQTNIPPIDAHLSAVAIPKNVNMSKL